MGRETHPESREFFKDTLVLGREEHLEALSMLRVRLVSVGIREVYAIRPVGGPVVTISVGRIIIQTAKFDILCMDVSVHD